jgi:hypothetical protein
MSDQPYRMDAMQRRRAAIVFATCLTFIGASTPLAVGAQGALDMPPASSNTQNDTQSRPAGNSSPGGPKTAGAQNSLLGAPSIPVDEIIKKFAAKESEFKIERENFTYTQTFICQTLDDSDRVDGEYRLTSDIVFSPTGKRYEKVTSAPAPTLERVELTQEDFNDLEHLYPFSLTTEDMSKYNIKYVDHVQLDELTTYTFDVAPKTVEKNQRYFQGRIWVDDKDLQIVKTFGRPVGYSKKKGDEEQLFPQFETFRENIEGKYWFPTYSRANEVLRFRSGPVHLRVTVKYENYQRFGVTVKIGAAKETQAPPDEKK